MHIPASRKPVIHAFFHTGNAVPVPVYLTDKMRCLCPVRIAAKCGSGDIHPWQAKCQNSGMAGRGDFPVQLDKSAVAGKGFEDICL